MWPILNGVSGIWPFAGSWAALRTRAPPIRPALAIPTPPTATPTLLRKPRRLVVDIFSITYLPLVSHCLLTIHENRDAITISSLQADRKCDSCISSPAHKRVATGKQG